MKFGQVIQYHMKNIFLEKWSQIVEKLLPDLFLRKAKLSIDLDQQFAFWKNFETLSFSSRHFFYMFKKSRRKSNYLDKEK